MHSNEFASLFVQHGVVKGSGDEPELAQAEGERVEAIKLSNLDALKRIDAPEYTAVFSLNPGKVVSKIQELAFKSRHDAGCALGNRATYGSGFTKMSVSSRGSRLGFYGLVLSVIAESKESAQVKAAMMVKFVINEMRGAGVIAWRVEAVPTR